MKMAYKFNHRVQEDVRPGLTFSHKQKRSLELYKKKQELQTKRPKSYHEQEKETREKGLNTAIPAENKGFQLLAKMGFKPGASLGKSQSGLKEPINVIVKENAAGVGREEHVKTVKQKKLQLKQITMKKQEQKFKAANVEKSIMWTLKRDFYKAQRVCEELDFREGVKVPQDSYFWTRDTMRKLKQADAEKSEESGSESESDDDEYEQQITEENLFRIIDYLREKYLYCLYCVFTATSQEDLETNCPGRYRLDHDSEEL